MVVLVTKRRGRAWTMKKLTQINAIPGLVMGLITCSMTLIIGISPGTAQEEDLAIMASGILLIQGSVREVSVEDSSIVVKRSKAGRVNILVAPQIDLIGVSSIAELKKGQQVKIWYNTVGEENRAVKVELLPDLGC